MRKEKGLTLVEAMFAVAIIAVFAAIAIPNLLRARLAQNETLAISSLRTIAEAQQSFQASVSLDTDCDGIGEFGTLKQLYNIDPPLIDKYLATGQKNGYFFTVTLGETADSNELGWEAQAYPLFYDRSGRRTFQIDESNIVRGLDIKGEKATRASANPEVGERLPIIIENEPVN